MFDWLFASASDLVFRKFREVTRGDNIGHICDDDGLCYVILRKRQYDQFMRRCK